MSKIEYTHQLPDEILINGQALTIVEVLAVARHFIPVRLGSDLLQRIAKARVVIQTIADEGRKVYGVTTGFGI